VLFHLIGQCLPAPENGIIVVEELDVIFTNHFASRLSHAVPKEASASEPKCLPIRRPTVRSGAVRSQDEAVSDRDGSDVGNILAPSITIELR
jgi:hypothetical protein